MSGYTITAIMPSLNEALNLQNAVHNVIESFDSLDISGEIVIVNDGSSDNTGAIAEELKGLYPFVRVIHHTSPQGIGASFWDGVGVAGGEIVVMIPGDGENDASETLKYLPLMTQVDIVVPFIFNKRVRSFKRRLLSSIYTRIINLTFDTSLNHTNGTVMYRKCILEGLTLKSSGFFFQTELLIKLIKGGYLFAEVPYALLQRTAGQSKAISFRTLRRVIGAYLGLLSEMMHSSTKEIRIHADSVTAKSHT